MATLDTKGKVSLSTFKPKDHGQAVYKDKPLTLGLIVGVASGVSRKNNVEDPDKPFVGLVGNFRCLLGDSVETAMANSVGVQSGICYLPDAWLLPIVEMIDNGEASSVEFAHKVSIERAENPAGYSWILSPLTPPAANDPLNAVLSRITPAAAIAAPETVAVKK